VKPVGPTVREVRVPALPAGLDDVQDLVHELLSAVADLAESDRIRFETATAEIVGNIIKHAVPADGVPLVTVTCTAAVTEEALRATFVDDGQLVDLALDAVGMPDPESEQGRGLALAVVLTDSLRYERTGATNRWTLECRRSRPR
jgi:anti-sigma regulatory factor (Ser/Thr protein kinase)